MSLLFEALDLPSFVREGHRRSSSLIFLMMGLSCLVLFQGCHESSAEQSRPRIKVEKIAAFRQPLVYRIKSGDTIESLCRATAGTEWPEWRDALLEELEPRKLRPGLIFEGERKTDGRLAKLDTRIDLRTSLNWERDSTGIDCTREELPVTTKIRRWEGSIESSLFAAVEKLGADPELAVRLASIYQWDIDFFRGLRKGDCFTVLAEEELVDGRHYRYGTLYAARFFNRGRELMAVAWGDDDGNIAYYDLEGKALKKEFLRSPLKFSRITSPFSMHRFHPVLHRSMPHYGVDYGAPVGTPVYATADGVVTYVGRNGGAGKMIRLRHTNGYETNYLHLSRYASGIRRGVRVRQKQIIGYVGATGMATGPHLDYRVKLNGRWINPMSISSPPAPPLPEKILPRYLAHALAVIQLLNGKPAPPGARC